MEKKHYTVSETAELLNVSEKTVYKMLKEGVLPGKKVGRLWRIPDDALETFEMPSSQKQRTEDSREQRKLSLGPAVISQRQYSRGEFLYLTGSAAVGGLVAFVAGEFLKTISHDAYTEQADTYAAKKLFEKVFGSVGPIHSFSLGEPIYNGYHRDNVAAANALIKPLGILSNYKPLVVPSNLRIGIDPRGDLVVIGGPISTVLTQIAWEYSGPEGRALERPKNPIVPLRWYGVADAKDASIVRDFPISWKMEGVGAVGPAANWPFEDTKTGTRIRPEPGEMFPVRGKKAYVPKDNYLLITKFPNFLSPDFGELLSLDPSVWPHLWVFEGSHGLGTRAAELLVSSAGLKALQEAERELRGATEFQVLFKVTGLDLEINALTGERFHKFHQIELVNDGVWSLDFLDDADDVYRRAHEYANDALQHM
jgi:excisionase family DNA binding protein